MENGSNEFIGSVTRPVIEWKGDVPEKCYCEMCGRFLFPEGQYRTIEEASENVKKCPNCLREVLWNEWKQFT